MLRLNSKTAIHPEIRMETSDKDRSSVTPGVICFEIGWFQRVRKIPACGNASWDIYARAVPALPASFLSETECVVDICVHTWLSSGNIRT